MFGFLKFAVVFLSLMDSAFAQGPNGVHDLKGREFTAEEVKRALIVPKDGIGQSAREPGAVGGAAKSNKRRGLGVVAADAPVADSGPPPPPPKLSMQLPFAFDSSEILDSAKSRLDALGSALQSPELVGERYIVSGHTDASGRNDYNMELSRRRAESVKAYLVAKHSVSPSRIVPVGKGSSDLIDTSDPRAAANRRVVIEGVR